ncbi:MAG: HAD family hydrolase [Helicobacteraceae bacterium]|jgi:phosphoglycolate phosphatase|nr:HAD family hydrolase [Helicobacteraceae bacterium]
MAKPATALFDLDGTLIDSTEAIVESFNAAFAHFNRASPDPEAIIKLIGNPLHKMFVSLGIEEAEIQGYIDRYKDRYRKVCLQKTTLLPRVKEALETLKPIAAIGVVTTKSASFSKEILAHFGIDGYFEAIVGFEDAKNPKPHPEPILLALERTRGDKRNAFMIGDTPIDINAALSAGVTPIALLCGYSTAKDFAPFDCEIVSNAFEAARSIAKRFL